ncbi:MAG: chitobiase/beta-hexosaminidase C-terminal domain-containing protein, partial [Planctomycetes bacterium]|nr:chitobiase/beta-hexosaminidase C-terminal domain-containing protein [Planctomycetota bacterium]
TCSASITLVYPRPIWASVLSLGEEISLGQRIKSFLVEARTGEGWKILFEGTTVGQRRIVRFPAIHANRFRVTVLDARAAPTLSNLGLFIAPPTLRAEPAPGPYWEKTTVRLIADRPDVEIRYTLDGSEPTQDSISYEAAIELDRSATLRAAAFHHGLRSRKEAGGHYEILDPGSVRSAWKLEKAPLPGLEFYSFGIDIDTLDELRGFTASKHGIVTELGIEERLRDDGVGMVFEGLIRVQQRGLWTFHLTSDDGSRVRLHGDIVVDNDGVHRRATKSAQIGLDAGWHPIRIEWFNASGDHFLNLEWEGPGLPRCRVGPEAWGQLAR